MHSYYFKGDSIKLRNKREALGEKINADKDIFHLISFPREC